MAPRTVRAKKDVKNEVLSGKSKMDGEINGKTDQELSQDVSVRKLKVAEEGLKDKVGDVKKDEKALTKGKGKKSENIKEKPTKEEPSDKGNSDVNSQNVDVRSLKTQEKVVKKVRGRKVATKVERSVSEHGEDQETGGTKARMVNGRGRKAQKHNALDDKPELTEAIDVNDIKPQEKLETNGREKRITKKKNDEKKEDDQAMDIDFEEVEENPVPKGRGKKVITKKALVKSNDQVTKSHNDKVEEKLPIQDIKPKSRGKKVQKKEQTPAEETSSADNENGAKELIPAVEKTKSKPRGKKTKVTSKAEPMQENSQSVEETLASVKQVKDNEFEEMSAKREDNANIENGKSAKGESDNMVFETPNLDKNLKQAGRGKRTAPKKTEAKQANDDESQDTDEPPIKKSKAAEKKPALKNKASTTYEDIDFSNTSKNSQGQPWNLKICSWNVDGIRAWLNKGGLDYIKHEKPDILCLQEVKCTKEKLPEEAASIPGYHLYWLCSEDKEGYAGVGIYTNKMAINVQYGIQDEEFDGEGRIITAEYEQFYLICTYVPNAGRKLVTLPKRLKWNEIFQQYVKNLDEKKPVIICGDMNVAHNEIDLSNPKNNKKNAGFTAEEREGMTTFLKAGFVDTFRHLYPDLTGAYTFWTYMMNSRAKNVGWRLDYMIVSERLLPTVCDNVIRSQVFGSDHCPIALFLHLSSVPKIPPE